MNESPSSAEPQAPAQSSRSLGQLAAALARAQTKIKNARADVQNSHFKNSYADLGAIFDACRVELAAQDIAVVQRPSAAGALVTVETLLIHKSGEWIASSLTLQAANPGPQPVGSCITYARRYSLSSMVGIAPDDSAEDRDDDGNSGQGLPESGGYRRPSQITPIDPGPSGAVPAGPKKLSQDQIKRLMAIAGEANWSDPDIKAAIKAKFGLESKFDLTWAQYEIVCNGIKQNPKPAVNL